MHFRYRKWFLVLLGICALLIATIIILAVILATRASSKGSSENVQFGAAPLQQFKTGKSKARWPDWPPPSDSPLDVFRHVAVVSDNGLCAEVGRYGVICFIGRTKSAL